MIFLAYTDPKFHEIQAYLIIGFDLLRKKEKRMRILLLPLLFLILFILLGFELQL